MVNTPPKLGKLSLAVAFSALAMGSVTQVAAQEATEITVTGSFISRAADRPQPVTIMDSDELAKQQRVTLVEAIRDLPQISSANTTNNFTNVTNSINLRGLGARSTLILLNGQRMTIDGNQNSQVDINNLAPSIMVERMELVLDGASALYGSDAVAGVANFITRNNFDGAEMRISSQHAEAQSSVPELAIAGIVGVQGDDTGVVFSMEYTNRAEAMNEVDRFDADRRATGLVTGLYNPGTYGSFGPAATVAAGWFADPLCGSPEIGGEGGTTITDLAGATGFDGLGNVDPGNPFCRGSLTHSRSIIPEMQRLTGFGVVTHQFDGNWLNQMTFEGGFAREEVRAGYGTGVPLLALPSISAVLPATNPGVIAANARWGDSVFPLQDYSNIFTRQVSPLEGDLDSTATQMTYRSALTLDGAFGDSMWDWRVAGTWSHNDQVDEVVDTVTERYSRAIQGYGGPQCKFDPIVGAENDPNVQAGVGNCLYWNPMANRLTAQPGDANYNDPTLLPWMQFGPKSFGEADLFTFEAVATGTLWEMAGGDTGVAIGYQFRNQQLDIDYGPIAKDGGFGFSPEIVEAWDSSRMTDAVFAEIVMFPTDTLEIDIAARYEDTEGLSSTEPKISALWTPIDNLFVRASAGSSFRLPSENNISGVTSGSVARAVIGGETIQATGLARGNPNLEPEESDNWTIGFTWDINDNWTVDATWWEYEFTNLVTSTDAELTLAADIADGFVDNFAANPLFPGRPNEVCEITGRWDEVGPLPAGCVTGFDFRIFNSSFINQNAVKTSGLDFSVDFETAFMGGEAGIKLAGAYVNEYSGTNSAGQLQDVVGTDGDLVQGVGTNPELRANLIVDYAQENHYLRSTWRYTAGTEITDIAANIRQFGIASEASWTQWDMVYTYYLGDAQESNFTVSILNVLDRDPPLASGGLNTSNSALFDPRGRMLRAGLNWTF